MLSRKKLMFYITSSMLVIGLTISGATYALFSSSASNSGNKVSAGTVNIFAYRDLGDSEAVPGPMFYSSTDDPLGKYPYDKDMNNNNSGEAKGGWAPGDEATRALNVENDGTLDAKITNIKAELNSETGETPSAQACEEFASKMQITVYGPTAKVIYNGSLKSLLNGYQQIPTKLQPVAYSKGNPVNFTFVAKLDITAGDKVNIQGQKFVFDFILKAEQNKNNPS